MERACHATAWPCPGRGDQGAVMPRQGEASGVQREAVEVRLDLVQLKISAWASNFNSAHKVFDRMPARKIILNFEKIFGGV